LKGCHSSAFVLCNTESERLPTFGIDGSCDGSCDGRAGALGVSCGPWRARSGQLLHVEMEPRGGKVAVLSNGDFARCWVDRGPVIP